MSHSTDNTLTDLTDEAADLVDGLRAYFIVEEARYQMTYGRSKSYPALDYLQTIFSLTAAFGYARINRPEDARQFKGAIYKVRANLWLRGAWMSKEQRLRHAAAIVDLRDELYTYASAEKKPLLPKSIAVASPQRIKALAPYSLNRLHPAF